MVFMFQNVLRPVENVYQPAKQTKIFFFPIPAQHEKWLIPIEQDLGVDPRTLEIVMQIVLAVILLILRRIYRSISMPVFFYRSTNPVQCGEILIKGFSLNWTLIS